jgi:hypothetical protein
MDTKNDSMLLKNVKINELWTPSKPRMDTKDDTMFSKPVKINQFFAPSKPWMDTKGDSALLNNFKKQ